MDRQPAMMTVFAEAFSETGITALIENGEDPGRERLNNLIEALAFLVDELADDDTFSREFVSALFMLGNRVPELMKRLHPEGVYFRPSLYEQADELTIVITALIENWNHWPDWGTNELRTYQIKTPETQSTDGLLLEQVGGYQIGDITYCAITNSHDCFPVRVTRLGNGYVDILPLVETGSPYIELIPEDANRRFFYPNLSPGSRFGGEDERLVNAARKTGPELRLLPVNYASKMIDLIRERHAADPHGWPLPTGLVFKRWFQECL